ncbi:MAG: LamG-like jellyroll fold domain-containing protein [Verrucomicrobiota bacterium]|jgi:hypothetical protein
MKLQKNIILGARGTVAALSLALGVAAATAQPYPTAVLADNPIAYWRLQETSGTIAQDSSITGTNSGVYTNVLLGQPGYINVANPAELAVAFGSPAGYSADSYAGGIPLDVASAVNTSFSVEAWVNGGAQAGGAGIVGKGSGGAEEFFLDCGASGNAFRFYIRNTAGTAYNANGTVVPNGNWHHLVGVCDEVNGYIYLYVDGQSNAVASASGGIRTTTNPYLTIGSRQSSSTTNYNYQFNGSISEVAMYSYALSAPQVLTHYFAAGIAPTITLQPTNVVYADEGSTLTLVAAATGTPPLAYQWTANGNPLAGQTNATLLLTNVPYSLNGYPLVLIVTNLYGSAYTAGTYLEVNSGAPQIVTDVQPLQLALYQGLSVTYSVGVSGTEPFYYQWLQNGTNVLGATASSYTLNTLLGTNTYSVIVSNNYGGGSITQSSTATNVGVAKPTQSYPATVLASQPIAYWRLDEATNALTANDYAGGHDGTYNNVALGLPGYSSFDPDTAAGFGSLSPTDSYMEETDNAAAGIPLINFSQPVGSNAAFSVEAWINAPAGVAQNTGGSAIVCQGASGAEVFNMDASGPNKEFRFYVRKAGSGGTSTIYSSAAVVPDGHWHHLVGVCDEPDGYMFFYVDGVIMGTIGSMGGTGLYGLNTIPVTVGAQYAAGDFTYQFVGTIDEVALYNYALSLAEVQTHFNAAPIAPYFTAVPVATTNAYVGETVTLSASAVGSAPLTNQWYANSSSMAGQTNFTLVLTNVQAGTNTYTLKVSNAYGSVTNLPGTVVQIPAGSGPPQLVADVKPLSTTLYSGVPLTYSVAASGSATLYYQWYFDSGAISGATSSSLGFSSLNATNAGTYYCHITNSLGSTNSSPATLAVVAAPTNPYPLKVISDHPVAYYRLDETTGPVGYDYVGGNNGYYSNGVIYGVSGCFGNLYDSDTAAFFGNQSNKNVFLGASITNVDFSVPNGQNGAFSVEAWAKGAPGPTNQSSGAGIVAKGVGNGDEQFALDAHQGFRFYVRNAASAASVAPAQASSFVGGSLVSGNWQMDNKWHYLVGVCDQVHSNILLYVDGSLIGPNVIVNGVVPSLVYAQDLGYTTTTGTNGVIYGQTGIHKPTNVSWNANSVSIGARNSGSGTAGYTLNFIGAVDEVALYNYALTPLQVSNHYAVAINSPLSMSVQLTNGHPSLAWPGTYATATLQSATNLTGPWGTVTNAASPYSVTNPATQQFYRIKLY